MKRWISGQLSVCLMVPALVFCAWPAQAAQDSSPVPALVVPEPPSLAEIARQEEARRRALRGKSKVYSDKDLKKAGPGTPPPPAPAGSTPPPSATPVPDAPAPAGGPPEAAAKGEAVWRNRMKQAREDLRRNEVFAEALQTRVAALTNEFVASPDLLGKTKVNEDRQKAMAELDRVKNEIENGKKAILEIEDDARKAGVPPGWLR